MWPGHQARPHRPPLLTWLPGTLPAATSPRTCPDDRMRRSRIDRPRSRTRNALVIGHPGTPESLMLAWAIPAAQRQHRRTRHETDLPGTRKRRTHPCHGRHRVTRADGATSSPTARAGRGWASASSPGPAKSRSASPKAVRPGRSSRAAPRHADTNGRTSQRTRPSRSQHRPPNTIARGRRRAPLSQCCRCCRRG